MIHNILPALAHLATPIELVHSLPGNPWQGDVEAMRVVLRELGQHRVLIANGNAEDGGIATLGNHMLQAAILEGWTHIAVAWTDEDEATVRARAITDNKMQSLGKPLDEQIVLWVTDNDTYLSVYDAVGYDDFTIAEMEESFGDYSETGRGYIAPEMVPRNNEEFQEPRNYDSPNTPRDTTIREASQEDMAVRGAGDTDAKRGAVIQYQLTFDDAQQQKRWHDFLRFMKTSGNQGTIAGMLLEFLEGHAEF